MEEHRRKKSSKIIYDMLVSRIRSEETAIIAQALKSKEGNDRQLQLRITTLKDLQHSLDWLVDKVINDRRKQ